jgi:site-specific recombinase XerD
MIEDMRMRQLSTKTQSTYIRAVRHFAGYLGRSPDTTSDEDLRRYQLHCVDRGVSPITLNATITGLKFFFEVTLKRPELMSKMSHVHVARTLPVVLSREEASRLIESARALKHRTALSVAYGAGLRVSEVIALKVGDVDSQRMLLRIEKGKGQKDRYALPQACGAGRVEDRRHIRLRLHEQGPQGASRFQGADERNLPR